MMRMSFEYGITWDEWETSNNGIRALKNVLTLGQDTSLMQVSFSYLYTHFFSMLVSLLYGIFHNDIPRLMREGLLTDTQILNFFNTSHFINAVFGFGAALFAGLFAKKLGGWRLAFLTLLLIGLSPRFFGNSMNNSKDIPFAATYMFCIYFMSFFLETLPKINIRAGLFTALGLGLCLGCRLGGIILILYWTVISAVVIFHDWRISKINNKDIIRICAALGGLITLGFAIGLIFWPYARSHSPIETARAFFEMSSYGGWKNLVLFEGQMIQSIDLPWYYISKWILISSPIYLPLGLILCAIAWKKNLNLIPKRLGALLLTAAFFPLVFIVIRKSNVYDGWRHLLFVYPSLVILCAMGLNWVWGHFAEPKKRIVLGLLFALVCSEPLLWMIKNPKNASVYFNSAVGGIKNSHTRYETDYWGSCLRESAEWLADYHQNNYGDFPFAIVWGDGTIMQTYPFLKKSLGSYYRPFAYPSDFLEKNPYVLYTVGTVLPTNLPWNYALVMSRHRSSDELKNQWPPPGTIHTVNADGVPLCAVIRNEAFYTNLRNAKK